VKKGQSVIQAAQKLADRHIRKSIANAVSSLAQSTDYLHSYECRFVGARKYLVVATAD
jgi:hypothetical protein